MRPDPKGKERARPDQKRKKREGQPRPKSGGQGKASPSQKVEDGEDEKRQNKLLKYQRLVFYYSVESLCFSFSFSAF